MVGIDMTLSDAIGRSHANSPLSNGSNLCTYESQINVNPFPIHFLIVFDRSFAILWHHLHALCLTNWSNSDSNSQDHLGCQALVSHTSSFSRAFDGGAPRVWDRSMEMGRTATDFNCHCSVPVFPRVAHSY